MSYLKKLLLIVYCLGFMDAFAQQMVLNTEEVVYSFTTANHKKVVIVRDKKNQYLKCRYGISHKIEAVFPENNQKLNYSFYMRGGGSVNEGLELNYVFIAQSNFKYVVYNTYYAPNDKREIGLKIINQKDNSVTDIKGILKSEIGSIKELRDDDLIEEGEELFD